MLVGLVHAEGFDPLVGDARDQVEVLVPVEDDKGGQLSCGCDQQVWD